MRGIEKYSQHWLDTIERRAPSFLRNTLRDGAPVPGGKHNQGLKEGTTTYRVHLFVKDRGGVRVTRDGPRDVLRPSAFESPDDAVA